jgi:hypothetical protein
MHALDNFVNSVGTIVVFVAGVGLARMAGANDVVTFLAGEVLLMEFILVSAGMLIFTDQPKREDRQMGAIYIFVGVFLAGLAAISFSYAELFGAALAMAMAGAMSASISSTRAFVRRQTLRMAPAYVSDLVVGLTVFSAVYWYPTGMANPGIVLASAILLFITSTFIVPKDREMVS